MSNIKIPERFDDHENIVRGIFHPLQYSEKKGLKDPSFLPPPNGCTVSVIRGDYVSGNDHCKQKASEASIPDNKFYGMAIFIRENIDQIIEDLNIDRDTDHYFYLLWTPLDSDSTEYSKDKPIYTNSEGNPFHADLVYTTNPHQGEVKTNLRKLARQLIKKAVLYIDENPDSNTWDGVDLGLNN